MINHNDIDPHDTFKVNPRLNILFLNMSSLVFNAATPDSEPLGGSESCVAYLARQLAQQNHHMTLMARLPAGFSGIAAGVQHEPLMSLKDMNFWQAHTFDAIIVCNAPAACPPLRVLNPKARLIFWDHVLQDQPSMQALRDKDVLAAIDKIVYASAWQKTEIEKSFSVTGKGCVIGNGLTPAFADMFSSPHDLKAAKETRAAYTATPYRGLSILLKAMKGLRSDLKLDVFSSMRVYQMADDTYASLYQEAAQDPRITCHGSVPQTMLADKLKPIAFLTYPCIFPETYCIGALEAMAAGMKVLSTHLGALPDTTMGYADLIPLPTTDADALALSFRALMEKNIAAFHADPDSWAEARYAQSLAINRTCSWAKRGAVWEEFLLSLQG